MNWIDYFFAPRATSHRNRGLAWMQSGEFAKAISEFSEVIRLEPTLATNYFSRGLAWAHRGEADQAINDYSQAIQLDPTLSSAYLHRGTEWCNKGELNKAISDYTEAIQLDPTFGFVRTYRGTAWSKLGEFDKAISDFDEAVRFDPGFAEAYNGRAYFRATCPDARYRNGQQAVEDATKACELSNWNDQSCIRTLADSYAEAGDFDAAIKWVKEAIALDFTGDWEEVSSRLALFETGKPFREKYGT
jgi:tetratricopeptide (TPR) repeat protein